MKPTPKYRWKSPHEWLEGKIEEWRADGIFGGIQALAVALSDVAYRCDNDGYFEELTPWMDAEDMDPHIPDLGNEGPCIYLANPNDIFGCGDGPFWKRMWIVSMSEFGPVIYVNADTVQDAIDEAIDFCEEMGWEGLFLDDDSIMELENDAIKDGRDSYAYLEEFTQGGNSCRYLSSYNVHIAEVVKGREIWTR